MEREQQVLAPVPLPVPRDAVRDGGDVGVLLPVLADRAQLGNPAPAGEFGGDALEDRGRRGRGVLRVHRQHQQALHAVGTQALERRADRRVAVAHGELHAHPVAAAPAQSRGESVGECARFDQQRRPGRSPDLAVGVRAARGTRAQDDAVQDQPPQQARLLDHARIPEELGEVAAHRRGGRLVGGAEVHEQHAGACLRAVHEVGGAEVVAHVRSRIPGSSARPYRNRAGAAPRGRSGRGRSGPLSGVARPRPAGTGTASRGRARRRWRRTPSWAAPNRSGSGPSTARRRRR
jgi:hypothetical protein